MAAASNGFFARFRSGAFALALAVPLLAAAACVPPDDTTQPTGPKPPTGGGGSGGTGGEGGQGGSGDCPEGATRDCSVTVGEHAGVLTCLEGTQTCEDGAWGPCSDMQQNKRPAPPPAVRQGNIFVKSLSSAVDCLANPCDPSCQFFDEVPAAPITSPPQNLIAPWNTGEFGGLPPALQAQGSTEPCSVGADCQFDQYCSNPTSGSCLHSKCVEGGGLKSTCDPCVGQICAGNPGCCSTPIQGTCAHDLCVPGTPLVAGAGACDPCVNSICSIFTYNFCCNQLTGAWTQDCVNQVKNVCNKDCSTGTWSQACVDQVKTQCNAHCLEENAPPCGHDKCYVGAALDPACDPCVAQVCLDTPSCCGDMGGTWTSQCVEKVATVCNETCGAKGDCVPWLPTQTDPDCFGFDLTIGVGCTNNGTPQVPVCNRGNANAPAGLPIAILPAAPPDELGNCYVGLGGATIVNTPAIVPPGECIDVPLPAGTPEGAQIGVNLANAPGYNFSECNCSNNWSIWSSGTGACDDPSCAGASAYAQLKKVKLFVTVDRSTSQGCSLGSAGVAGCPTASPTRWEHLKGAFTSFITDPTSDSLGMWMRYFPYNLANGSCPGPSVGQCNSTPGCRTPNAEVADLATAANENALLSVMNGLPLPAGNTPLYPALDGALSAAASAKLADPSLAPAVIVVTDGLVTQCTGNGGSMAQLQQIADLAALYFNNYNIRTYIIGVDVIEANIQLIAGAGGGKAFAIDIGDPIQTLMLDALNQIKQEFVPCTIDLPDLDIFDPSQATFTYTPGAGAPVTLPQVASQAACGGTDGWYYDDPADPSSVTLCDATCDALKTDTSGTLSLEIACLAQYQTSTYTQKYEADCPQGTVPQWGYLAYDTVTPGDSQVELRFHTSDDDVTYGALSAATVASAALNSQVCPMAGPAPCPVDLYAALGGLPDARKPFLEVQITLVPTSDANQTPSVNNWQVTYSCPDAE